LAEKIAQTVAQPIFVNIDTFSMLMKKVEQKFGLHTSAIKKTCPL
jgi:dTDP-4-amino-4,6-dideoxygalactose transaminase